MWIFQMHSTSRTTSQSQAVLTSSPSHPQTSARSNAYSISPISHPNQHSSFQQTPLRTQIRRLTMIITMLTPHHTLRRVGSSLCCTLHHAVPAAIEEAADEEDDAIAGLGGCVREERIEEFDARQVIQFAILFRSV